MKDILIVEDDEAITRVLKLAFQYEHYQVDFTDEGLTGYTLSQKNDYKVILLDVMVPGINGLELCRRIRRDKTTHIIMMTAKRDVTDVVAGLDMGADDYLTKPFKIEELLARIRAAMRRADMQDAYSKKLSIGPLKINQLTREVDLLGESIELTKTEYSLLEYLAFNAGLVMTRDQIIEQVWGYDYVGDTNILDVYIKYLRNKLDNTENIKLIKTVRGVGYTLKVR